MTDLMLVRFYRPETGPRVGLQRDGRIYDVTDSVKSIGDWLRASAGRVDSAIAELHDLTGTAYPAADFDNPPTPDAAHLLAPVDTQEVWAAGVTYERSREARQQEAVDGGDVYARVYAAERPEIFFKALAWRVIGSRGEVGIRADATWSVPEPELGVVYNPHMEPVGFVVGNDMSSRDIEGANPLYLPQAKAYTAACALGPGIVLNPSTAWPDAAIRLNISRGGAAVVTGEVHTDRIRRTISELGGYLGRSNHFPDGVVLLTGTGIVPPAEFTLAAGDVVEITIEGVGTLTNVVKVV